MKEEIKLLIELQEKDSVINEIREKAQGIPVLIQEKNEILAQFSNEVNALKDDIKRLQVAKKEKEMDLGAKENELKKHNIDLNTIKTNDAYKSMLSEIEKCKQAKQVLEDDILNIMDATEKETVEIKTKESKLKEKEAAIKSEISAMENELKAISDKISSLESDRNEFAKKIPEGLLNNYEHICEGTQGLAVVSIDGENCGGCSITLRPQIINDVLKGQDLVTCDSCSRILYKKTGPAEVSQEKQKSEPADKVL